MKEWWGLVPRIKALDTDRGGEIWGDIPCISPHLIPPKHRAVDLYLVEAELVDAVLLFVHEQGGRVTDQNGDLT